jgi:hypothetical protein
VDSASGQSWPAITVSSTGIYSPGRHHDVAGADLIDGIPISVRISGDDLWAINV